MLVSFLVADISHTQPHKMATTLYLLLVLTLAAMSAARPATDQLVAPSDGDYRQPRPQRPPRPAGEDLYEIALLLDFLKNDPALQRTVVELVSKIGGNARAPYRHVAESGDKRSGDLSVVASLDALSDMMKAQEGRRMRGALSASHMKLLRLGKRDTVRSS